jgi:hypothetical protein
VISCQWYGWNRLGYGRKLELHLGLIKSLLEFFWVMALVLASCVRLTKYLLREILGRLRLRLIFGMYFRAHCRFLLTIHSSKLLPFLSYYICTCATSLLSLRSTKTDPVRSCCIDRALRTKLVREPESDCACDCNMCA